MGGDFYDVIALADGRIMIVTGDVTDKGVPAALVMASTHALLRAAAQAEATPGRGAASVNDLLHPQIPIHMFVTCLVLIIDPATGATTFANAGHNLPYLCRDGQVSQLSARGMPLGLMPGSSYEEHTAQIEPGDIVVLYSDGITEQHDADGEMFGFERAAAGRGRRPAPAPNWWTRSWAALAAFQHRASSRRTTSPWSPSAARRPAGAHRLGFTVPSATGNEREAMDRVVAFVADALPPDRLASLGTAVSETAMNAIEHGNRDRVDLPVEVEVIIDPATVRVERDRPRRRAPATGRRTARPRPQAGRAAVAARLGPVPRRAAGRLGVRDDRRDRHTSTVHLEMHRAEGGPS